MTKFEQYKAAIRLVGGWMVDRMEAILLSGHGDVLSDELGALTGLLEGALQQYLQKQDPADIELGRKLLEELKATQLPTAQQFHEIGCAIVGPND